MAEAEESEEFKESEERSAVGRVGTEAEIETDAVEEAGKDSEAEALERVPQGGEREEGLEGETS